LARWRRFRAAASCGSTTALRCAPTERRRIGILFQDALLFDHFSVGQNLLLALPADVRGEARKIQVEQALEPRRAGGFPRDPATLSGGQRARVSLLRALLARPRRCCWMSRLTAWMPRCAPIFAAGYLTNWRARPFRRCW
jgi:putative thiamine transport system ATP-binding protein